MSTAKVKSAKPAPASERLRELYRPGVLERGLKILAKEQDEAAAKRDAPAPEGLHEDPRLLAAKIVAEVDLKDRLKQVQREIDAEAAERDAQRAAAEEGNRFDRIYVALLRARAAIKDPDVHEGDMHTEEARMKVFYADESATKRELFLAQARDTDQLLAKLEVFEADLLEEQLSGPKKDSLVLVALASIKQDIFSLGLLESAR